MGNVQKDNARTEHLKLTTKSVQIFDKLKKSSLSKFKSTN